MSKEEKVLKERSDIIKLLKEVKSIQLKANKSIAKIKSVDLSELLRLSEVAKEYIGVVESCDRWVRKNNELIKKLIVESGSKLRLTQKERDTLEGGEG